MQGRQQQQSYREAFLSAILKYNHIDRISIEQDTSEAWRR